MALSSPSESSTSGPAALAVLRRHPLVAYFVLAYVVTWLLWSPVILSGGSVSDPRTHAPNFALLPGVAVGVTGVGVFMIWVTQGRPGLRRYGERLATWRVGPLWWAVAILLLPVGGILAAAALGAPDVLRALTPAALVFYPAAWASHLIFGPLFEESGWRGFALPRLQHRFGPARGSLVLGLLWSAWHFFLYAPMWFAGGVGGGLGSLVIFTVITTSMTFTFTWLSNRTRASLLLVILLHASVDGTQTYLSTLADHGIVSPAAAQTANAVGLLVVCVLAAVVLLLATRGRLGYASYGGTPEEARDLDVVAAR